MMERALWQSMSLIMEIFHLKQICLSQMADLFHLLLHLILQNKNSIT